MHSINKKIVFYIAVCCDCTKECFYILLSELNHRCSRDFFNWWGKGYLKSSDSGYQQFAAVPSHPEMWVGGQVTQIHWSPWLEEYTQYLRSVTQRLILQLGPIGKRFGGQMIYVIEVCLVNIKSLWRMWGCKPYITILCIKRKAK